MSYTDHPMHQVLDDVQCERLRQDEKWGADRDMPSVHIARNPTHRRAMAYTAHDIRSADAIRERVERLSCVGRLTWCDILQEELSESVEAAADGDLDHLYTELVQVAAVAVAWAENVRRKKEQG